MYQNMNNEEGLLKKINSGIVKSYERVKIAVIILMALIILDIAFDDIKLILSITGIFNLFNLIVVLSETVQAVIMIYIIKNFSPKFKDKFETLVMCLAFIEGCLILSMIVEVDLSIFKWFYHLVFVILVLWLLQAASLM